VLAVTMDFMSLCQGYVVNWPSVATLSSFHSCLHGCFKNCSIT